MCTDSGHSPKSAYRRGFAAAAARGKSVAINGENQLPRAAELNRSAARHVLNLPPVSNRRGGFTIFSCIHTMSMYIYASIVTHLA